MSEDIREILIDQSGKIGHLTGVVEATSKSVDELKTILEKYSDVTTVHGTEITKIKQDRKWMVGMSSIIAAVFGWIGNHFAERIFK